MARPASLSIPSAIADEIEAAATRCERSTGFLVLGALKAAGALTGPPAGARRALELTFGEDDPRDLPARMKKLAADKGKGLSLDDAVALAWSERRTQILAWVDRVSAIDVGERADELDEGLRAAADPKTAPAKLAELSRSAYPRVRALVAAHAATPREVLERLRSDREPVVRETLAARG